MHGVKTYERILMRNLTSARLIARFSFQRQFPLRVICTLLIVLQTMKLNGLGCSLNMCRAVKPSLRNILRV